MSRMSGPGGGKGGGAASERAPHEDPRGDEEFGAEEASRSEDTAERAFRGKKSLVLNPVAFAHLYL